MDIGPSSIINTNGKIDLSSVKRAEISERVNFFNKSLPEATREAGGELGKDDFLEILLVQLQNQDPTKPMEDKEFISQMAQFSALEQTSNLNNNFTELSATLSSGQMLSLLGQEVEISRENSAPFTGSVNAISVGTNPQLEVNGNYYDYTDISRIIK